MMCTPVSEGALRSAIEVMVSKPSNSFSFWR